MNNKLIALVVLIVIAAAAVFYLNSGNFINPSPSQHPGDKFSIVTSIYPVYFLTKEITADKAEVSNITPAGTEPHDYELGTADRAKIEKSSLLVLNGSIEPWADDIKNSLAGKSVKVVTAGENLLTKEIDEDGETIKDPHIWLSPALAKNQASAIAAALIENDPSNAPIYTKNVDALKNRLDQLDNEYKNGLRNCQRRDFITSHAAFAYLAESYNLRQISISGISPDEEPSPRQLAEVAKFAKENNVKYIFFETLVSPKLSQTIANEVGAQTLVLNPLEGLSDDEIREGKDYFSEMKSNLENLRKALECR